MATVTTYTLDYFPENILIEILSYLTVQELVRNARVCKRWRALIKDQRLWRTVDISTWKRVTSRVLWTLLRQYLGRGVCFLHLRGLLQSSRGGSFLSEPWLQTLSSKCPRLRRLTLTHTDLRGLHSCSLLPPSLQVLELRSCELPPGFFTQGPLKPIQTDQNGSGKKSQTSSSSVVIEELILDNVPSFTDQHLMSLSSWERLWRLELRDVLRVTVAGLKGCAPPGPHALTRLTHLELEGFSRQQMAALGLADGWAGLERLTLGGREVAPGLLCLNRLVGLRWLRLRGCRLTETLVLRSCGTLKELRVLEFLQVDFATEPERKDSERDKRNENDPIPALRQALSNLLPKCNVMFTQCNVIVGAD
ncbi:F-box/LRR-repeat protein 12 [Tachysurus fulvidraco]|uniref:F-box/LRR-repeat protein 12 n=1 Tax=Tachysurus fulvidraco TaxID=1234273 RepID=UPI000F4F3A1D|nr:F-box/LRR-repeat protein 12 [Tachysurus fulvidraco]